MARSAIQPDGAAEPRDGAPEMALTPDPRFRYLAHLGGLSTLLKDFNVGPEIGRAHV